MFENQDKYFEKSEGIKHMVRRSSDKSQIFKGFRYIPRLNA